ncbi:MAG: leucine-rich repeat protein, partial [Lachnospiraceae bacterium]|nr:leucine-rich repeat protein [Lachnospiraceae bacterium]
IEAIAEGIFSGVDRNNEQAYEYIYGSSNTPGGTVPDPSASQDPNASPDPTTAPGGLERRPLKVNEDINSITMQTVETIDPYTFAGCTKLSGVYMSGGNKVDNYAFKNCTSLVNVEIAPSVAELGLRPFAGCDKLQEVKFGESTNFTCENQIIFGLTDGAKTKIVECLEARGETVGSPQIGPEGLETITELAEEAFKDCNGIGSVDLTSSSIGLVPREAFSRTGRIYSVKLPTTTKSIRDGAFWNSNVSYLEIPSSVTFIENDAFANVLEENGEIKLDDKGRPEIDNVNEGHRPVTFYCTEGNAADVYSENYYYINPTYFKPIIMHEVRFWNYPNYPDRTPVLYYETQAADGEAAVPPEDPKVEGYAFVGWSADYTNVVRDMDLYANYSDHVYTVTFTDSRTGEVLDIQQVGAGKSAKAPEPKVHEGFTFDKWSRDFSNVTEDIIVSALYTDNSGSASRHKVVFYDNDGTVLDTQMVDHEDKARPPVPPTKEGYTFIRWIPSDFSKVVEDMNIVAYYEPGSGPLPSGQPQPSGQPGTQPTSKPKGSPGPTATPTATPSNEDNVVKYTVSVSGGSGSGSYPAGAIVAINAYYRGEGQVFDRWTSSTAGVGFANPNASSTTFTMPAANVAVTATYKTGSGSTGASGSGGSGGGTGSSGGLTGSSNHGTSVEVTTP